MKPRLLQRTRSVSAARMTVGTYVPLGVKWAIGCIAFAGAVAVGVGLARTGPVRNLLGDPDHDATRLIAENQALRGERDRAREIDGEADSRRVMEGSTIKELGEQILRLEADNARLKEDVAFFEAATADRPAAGAKKGSEAGSDVAIRRFQVVHDPAAHVGRYRILLTQDSRAARDFSGTLQLALSVVQAGHPATLVVPEDPGKAPFAVAFKSYKRIDGTFAWPADSVLRSVQARVLERGAVRAQQTVAVD